MGELTFLTRDDLENVPQEMLPMPVLSDNLRGFFSWGIKVHEKGAYGHYMWMIHPGQLASQSFLYQLHSVKDYVDDCRLKLWSCPSWSPEIRHAIIKTTEDKLGQPWYKRIYDVPAVFGQLVWKEIQIPGLSICSDYGAYLKQGDDRYNLEHPDPEDVNAWLESHPEKYEVYGRYVPD